LFAVVSAGKKETSPEVKEFIMEIAAGDSEGK
jgi:hypothetical protein